MTMNFTRNTVNRLIYVLLLIKLECINTLVLASEFLSATLASTSFFFIVPGSRPKPVCTHSESLGGGRQKAKREIN